MRNLTSSAIVLLASCYSAVLVSASSAEEATKPQFVFTDAAGTLSSVPFVEESARRRITQPIAKANSGINPKLLRAATIAQERAHAHSKARCWQYVKEALLASGAVDTYPKTSCAKEAGNELVRDYGFIKLATRDPYAAPVGAVLVYGAAKAPGHVEIRTSEGFVSDFRAKTPSPRPLLGIYAKA